MIQGRLIFGAVSAVALAGTFAIVACNAPPDERTATPAAEALANPAAGVARGEYLVKHLLLCGNCHNSQVDGGAPLSGGKSFSVALPDGGTGAVYAANLTSDDTTGLGTWTVDQIVTALRQGVDDQGAPLHPTMPYSIYGNLARQDAVSIALYLKSLPPAANAVPERTVTVDAPAPTLDESLLPQAAPSSPEDERMLAHGRYLSGLACVDCHTVRKGTAPDLSMAFAGGRAFGPKVKSSNLTPDTTGLGGWTQEQIVDTLKTGHRQGTGGAALCPPMPSGGATVGGLTDTDLNSMAAYLQAIPAVHNGPFEADGGCR